MNDCVEEEEYALHPASERRLHRLQGLSAGRRGRSLRSIPAERIWVSRNERAALRRMRWGCAMRKPNKGGTASISSFEGELLFFYEPNRNRRIDPMNREMPKAYDHSAVENRLYETWEKNGYFVLPIMKVIRFRLMHPCSLVCMVRVSRRCGLFRIRSL